MRIVLSAPTNRVIAFTLALVSHTLKIIVAGSAIRDYFGLTPAAIFAAALLARLGSIALQKHAREAKTLFVSIVLMDPKTKQLFTILRQDILTR